MNNYVQYLDKSFHSDAIDVINTKIIDQNTINSVKNNFLLNLNIRSLSAHYDELMMFLNELNNLPALITLTETFLTEDTKLLYDIPGYQGYHTIRQEGNAGGVSVYVQKSYVSSQLYNLSYANNIVEQVAVSATINSINYKVIGIYRRPCNDRNLFIDHIDNLSEVIKNNKVILCGDININLFNYHCNTTQNYINAMISHGFSLCNNKISRINADNIQNSSLIDHIWTNVKIDNLGSYNIIYDISDHIPCMLTFKNKQCESSKTIHYRIINDHKILQLNKKLEEVNWVNLLSGNDVGNKFHILITKLDEIYNKVIPIKTKTLPNNLPFCPWVDRELKIMIKHKRNLFQLYKMHSITQEYYREYVKKVNRIYVNKRAQYFIEKMEVNDVKKQWSNLKKLVNYSKIKNSTITNLKVENKTITNKKDICNELNNYFVNIGPKIASTIPKFNNNNFSNYLDIPCANSFKFFKITEIEVKNTIKSFKNKSCNINEIPIKIYKAISEVISKPLTNLMNECLDKSIYPEILKVSRITAVHKGGEMIPNNFRPISNLHKVNKIFEKIIFNRLMAFFEKFNILSLNQFAYQKNNSTTNALDIIMEKIYSSLNKKKYVMGVFLDQSKAFDLVVHSILLEKLKNTGIRGKELELIRNYLSGRKQYVKLGNEESTLENVSMGVPQGSTLGPLLYLVYINDLKNCHNLEAVLYADDLSLFFASENLNDLYSVINENLTNVYSWFCTNSLKLNSKKSNYLLFAGKKRTYEKQLKLGDNIINRNSHIKLLGVTIDDKLTFKKHINAVSSKISFVGHLLSRCYYLPEYVKKKLYFSYAHPMVVYGITVWGRTYENHKKTIKKSHKRLVKKINNSKLNYRDSLKKYGILNIDMQTNFTLATNIHKVIYGNAPTLVKNLINKNKLRNSGNRILTRRNNQIRKPKVNVNCMKRSFDYAASKVWNEIPNNIKNPNYKVFKKKAKAYFIDKL